MKTRPVEEHRWSKLQAVRSRGRSLAQLELRRRALRSGLAGAEHRPLQPPLQLTHAVEPTEAERLANAVARVLGSRSAVAAAARVLGLRESVLRGCVCRAQCAELPRSLPPLSFETEAEPLLRAVELVLGRRASVHAAARTYGISESVLRGHLARAQRARGR